MIETKHGTLTALDSSVIVVTCDTVASGARYTVVQRDGKVCGCATPFDYREWAELTIQALRLWLDNLPPPMPDGWNVQHEYAIGVPYCITTNNGTVRIDCDCNAQISDEATSEQCAQIPAALKRLRFELTRAKE